MATDGTQIYSKRYRLQESLGQGGMGEVFRAIDRLNVQPVALKMVNAKSQTMNLSSDSMDARTSLTREFELLASIRHPNIISVLDYGFDKQKQPYFTMELLRKPAYITQIAAGHSLEFQVKLLVQMLQALSYLYRRDILHRDLKPANVLVVDEQLKILDFGLAMRVDSSEMEADDGDVAGTLAYVAPEVLTGSAPSVAADLYAVGIIAYEMFAGKYPFDMSSFPVLVSQIVATIPKTSDLGIPDALQLVLDRLLSKDPEARYKTADEVIERLCEAIGIPTPPETSAVRESFLQAAQFVGRKNELAELVAALEKAEAGNGSLWLVGGESGVGKTRLMDELRIQALVRGITLTRGQTANEGGLTYQVWRDVLRWLSLLTGINPFEASILKAILPDIDTLVDYPIPVAPEIDPRGLHERLLGIVQGIFARLEQPVVILLDDLQWAGDESILLLQRLTQQLTRLPILIVGTYRDDERPKLHEELPGSHLLKLKRLAPDAIAALSQSMIGKAGEHESVVKMLERETEGNVFFIVEVLRVLAENAGSLDQIGTVTLPHGVYAQGIHNLVQRRLERIPEHLKPLVLLAAISGRVVDEAVLVAALPDIDVPKALTIAADAAVFDVANNQWRFTHDKIRESVLQQIDGVASTALHAQIAAALEVVYPDDADKAAKLAYHWHHGGNEDKERYYSHQAGELELQNGAYHQANRHLERAFELTEKLPETPENIQQELNIQLNIATLRLITRGQSATETKLAYDKAYELVNKLHQSPQLFQVLFGMWAYYLFSGAFDEAWQVSHQCLTLAEQFNISGMIIESKVAVGNTAFWMGDFELARQYMQDAIAIYVPEEHDKHLVQFGQDPRITSRIFGSWATFILGYPEEALKLSFEAYEIGKARQHSYSIVMALQILAWNYYHVRDVEPALKYGGELVEMCQQEDFPIFLAAGLMLQGWAKIYATTPQEGINQIEQAVNLWQSLGGSLPTFPILILTEAYLHAGDFHIALEKVQTGLQAARESKELAYESELLRLQGEILRNLKQPEQARAKLEESLTIARSRKAKAFELRTLMSLYQLAPDDTLKREIKMVVDSYTEGTDTADLVAAKRILQ